ncbi:uncharacterized protein LOC134252179 [Saccostrea cucullata]|uniref:uncharacterized protein LOC134252179 n=1 Tax=Saccostrea cuccullata TaxID=36930 RepID=UPI002ED54AB3
MFLSVDPEACSKSSFSNNDIDMYLKTCFTHEVNNTILVDNSVALIPDTSCMVNIPLISSTPGDFTMQSTNSVPITMTTTNNPDVCTCPCRANSTKSIEQQLMDIKKELTINKKKTSAYLRTLSCADDYRPSSKVIGYAGIIFIVLEISLFVFLDSPNLMKLFKFIYKKR